MSTLIYVTGNQYNLFTATKFLSPYGINVVGKKIDELSNKIALNLDYLKDIYKEEPISGNRYYHSGDDIIYIDLTADTEWAVLRYMFRRNDGSLDESYRVFVHNNGKV